MIIDNREIQDLPDGSKKELPFSVPEGYFEDFPSRLQERLETERKPGFFEKTYRTLKPGLAIAAIFAAIILAGYAIIKLSYDNGRKTEPIQEFAEVIDYYIYDFDDETIIAVFNEETDLNYLNHTLKEEEISNYLSEEDDLDYSELQNLY
jgi:hypothetical protein